jgi:hypothetical protein
MPEDIEPRHCPVDLIDKPRADRRDSSDGCHSRRRATEQDEPCRAPLLVRHPSRDLIEQADAFLDGHGAHDAADHAVGRPRALPPPVPRMIHDRSGHAGMHDVHPVRVDSSRDQRIANGVRNGNETRDAWPVLDPSARHERDAPGDDERDASLSHERREGDGVRSRVVGVDNVRAPGLDALCDFARRSQVPVPGSTNGGNRQPRRPRSSQQW